MTPEVSEPEVEWRAALGAVEAVHGRLHVLVNNAGMGSLGSVEEVTPDAWRQVMAVNIDSVYLGCRAFLLLRRIGIDVALGTAHRLLLLSYCGLDRRNGRWNLRHRHDALGGGLLAHDLKQAQALLVEEDQVAGGAGFEFVEHRVDLE